MKGVGILSSKFNNYLNQDEKELILKMHNEGYNTVEIAKRLNRSDSSIGRFLRKNNLTANWSKCKLKKSDKENIIQLYQQGLTAKEILPLYCDRVQTENTIMSIVKQAGVNRPRGTVSDADKDYFSVIDTEAKAYYLGLLLTDGNVHQAKRNTEQYVIQIDLKADDREIIEKFKAEIHSSNQIRMYQKNKRNECLFGVCSTKMAYDLMDKGVFPNKTFEAELNYNIPPELFRHYIRGIFDGDGTVFISKDKLRFGFYGTHKLVSQIQEWLGEQINISQNKVFDKPTVSFVIYQKKMDVLNFYNLMYNDATFYLKRKKNKFDDYFAEHCVNTEVTN